MNEDPRQRSIPRTVPAPPPLRPLLSRLLAAAALLALCSGAAAVTLVGADTVAHEIIEPVIEPFRNATGYDIELLQNTTGQGVIALLRNEAEAAMVAESLDDALYTTVQLAKERGIALEPPSDLVLTELGYSRLVFIVNADNPVARLSRTQLKDIFTGRIGNWLELGGANRPIVPVTTVLGSAIRTVLQRQVMDGADYRTGILEAAAPGDVISVVAREYGAIAAVSLSLWSSRYDGTRMVETPTYNHPLGLVTIGRPNAAIRRLLSFVRANSRK